MKKYIVIVLCWFCFCGKVGAQVNLVPNGSFETYAHCPTILSNINDVPPWLSAGGSPDYYNQCSADPYGTWVPLNWSGYQYARTGGAYIGMYFYDQAIGGTYDQREYLQVLLSDSLQANKKYCISFYVNLAKPFYQTYNVVAISEIGVYISDTAVHSINLGSIPFNPQVVSPPGVFLNDTVNWTEISGLYNATGGEKYITIGNFKPFGMTDTMEVVYHYNYAGAYYFIDDVSIIDCTNQGINETDDANNITLSPNPTTSAFTVSIPTTNSEQPTTIYITDVLGKSVYTTVSKERTISIALNNPPGIYFVAITVDGKRVVRKLVKE